MIVTTGDKCPYCKGNFIVGWKQNNDSLFGLIGSPPSPILCSKCTFGVVKHYHIQKVISTRIGHEIIGSRIPIEPL